MLIHDILSDEHFRPILRQTAEHSVSQSNRVRRQLSEILRPIDFGSTVLLARGSLARGDYCRHSDLDLQVISPNNRVCPILERSLRKALTVHFDRVGIDMLDASSARRQSYGLTFWLGANESIYICGEKKLFSIYKHQCYEMLKAMTGEYLVSMHYRDPRRHSGCYMRESPYRWNIKRGAGGIVDYEFASLLKTWSRMLCKPTKRQAILWRDSYNTFQYLSALKAYQYNKHGGPRETACATAATNEDSGPEIFSKTIIERVLDDHQEIVNNLIGTIKGHALWISSKLPPASMYISF